uniref:Uncharacterized protein n=1 Tax=Oryzias sinensis TaxID=183150 RepID=A0A8C7WRX5_9TELE
MELPFTSFELTFIIIAFLVFSLFGLASVCIEPKYGRPAHCIFCIAGCIKREHTQKNCRIQYGITQHIETAAQ